MTSSTPKRTRSQAGTAPHATPATHPAPSTQHTAIAGGSDAACTPAQVAAIAPA